MGSTDFKTLREMEGELIIAHVPIFHATTLQKLRLHKVEEAGIWVENQNNLDDWFKTIGYKSSPKTLIYFLPWHTITFVMTSLDIPSFSTSVLK